MPGGHGPWDAPTANCPYCGAVCEADWVDVGVGMVQCGPYHCLDCGASEIGPHDDERELSEEEEREGWYAPHSEPGSSANVVGGRIVSHTTAREVYRRNYPFSATEKGKRHIREVGDPSAPGKSPT